MTYRQKHLGGKGFLVMLALISSFPPLSTDLYLPALPKMMEILGASQSKVNLTLSQFFIFFAAGLLLWGPLSEKFGRKPVLLTGLVLYAVASMLCAVSNTVEQLILARILQAFGGSAATAVATAVIKDVYTGKERERVLALVMTMVIIAPVVAPVIGALLLKIASWRAIFWTLAGVAAVSIVISCLFQETLNEKYQGTLISTLGRLIVVLKNPGFSSLLAIFSLVPVSMMAFLASSSYIYINRFGLTEQQFSFFFAFNAMGAMLGPMLFIRISRRFSAQHIITACFFLIAICGGLVCSIGGISFWIFSLLIFPATLSVTMIRPPGINIMLNQQTRDTGPAASLINFFAILMGSLGMVIISMGWKNQILALGFIQFIVGIGGGSLWIYIRNKPFIVRQDPEKR